MTFNQYFIASLWTVGLVVAAIACYQIWRIYKKFSMISPEYKWVVSSIICFTLTGALILLHHIVEFSEKEMFEALTTLLAVVFYIVGVAMFFKSSLVIKGIFETLRKELEKSS